MTEEPTTEAVNDASTDLDRLSTRELVAVINDEDSSVARAVASQADAIAEAIDVITERLSAGGRLVYVGAGTSGRLGVLDASECPPTFSADPGQVVGIIAGGDHALRNPIEGAEDSRDAGREDLVAIDFSGRDVLVGIAASGSTPYVLGALRHARSVGARTIGLTCNSGTSLAEESDMPIEVVTGPEVLAGSTRMKAGTATKMVLNMLTTGTMVRLGKTYGNLMVDLKASNDKLKRRALRLLMRLASLSQTEAREKLEACNGELKTAVVSARLGVDAASARERLASANGRLRLALDDDA